MDHFGPFLSWGGEIKRCKDNVGNCKTKCMITGIKVCCYHCHGENACRLIPKDICSVYEMEMEEE